MLIILDQVTHGVKHITPRAQVTPVDQANPQPVLMFIFFEVAVVEVALRTGDALPQLADPLCPVDVGTHFSAAEEESSVDVIPTILALFNAADVHLRIDYCCRVQALEERNAKRTLGNPHYSDP